MKLTTVRLKDGLALVNANPLLAKDYDLEFCGSYITATLKAGPQKGLMRGFPTDNAKFFEFAPDNDPQAGEAEISRAPSNQSFPSNIPPCSSDDAVVISSTSVAKPKKVKGAKKA